MKLYLAFVKNSFQSNTAYRTDTFTRIIYQIILIFIQISLWQVLMKNNVQNIGAFSISIREMITYVIISTAVSIMISNSVIYKIDGNIKSGQIGIDLIKPMNFKAYLFCDMLGNNGFRVIFEMIPMLLVGILAFGIKGTDICTFFIFLVSVINGMLIYFFLAYILGMIGFWYISIWHFSRLLDDVIKLLSGSLIPLWFLPKVFIDISNFLPFKFIYFIPISIYLKKFDIYQSLQMIGMQFGWIAILFIIQRIVWSKGIKNLVIQGG